VLVSLFGGKVRAGKVAYVWCISGAKTQKALREMLPYLVYKKAQAEICLYYLDHLAGRQGATIPEALLTEREALWLQLRELNRIGVYHAERLSEEAPQLAGDDAIVRTASKREDAEAVETAARLSLN
jgi:hypothetical protein